MFYHQNKKKIGPIHRRADNPRNSSCGSARIQDLDWSTWFTDSSFGGLYLHVRNKEGAGDRNTETWHRVYCRMSDKPRLTMHDGVLYWAIDENATSVPTGN